MKNIHTIMSSELITKVNNVNVRKEQGIVGTDTNIIIDGTDTIIQTDYSIDEIIYVAVQDTTIVAATPTWSTLVFGKDYTVDTQLNQIRVLPVVGAGPAAEPVPEDHVIYVCYLRARGAFTTGLPPTSQILPTIDSFVLDPATGGVQTATFDFSIIPNDGVNISWSIIRNGDADSPLYRGTALFSTAGQIPDGSGGFIDLDYDVLSTDQEQFSDNNEGLVFTLIVAYEVKVNPDDIVGTLLADTNYVFDAVTERTYDIDATPDVITVQDSLTAVTATYTINNPSSTQYDWIVRRTTLPSDLLPQKQTYIDLDSGSSDGSIIDANILHTLDIDTDNGSITYQLLVRNAATGKTASVPAYVIEATDTITIAVPGILDNANVGYIRQSEALYEVSAGTWIVVDTEPVYTAMPNLNTAFTISVGIEFLSNNTYFEAPVDPSILTSPTRENNVYFVIEVPDTWGPVEFYQDLGVIRDVFFNEITLVSPKDGYTAYIYASGSSSKYNPIDFKIRPKT